MYNSITRRYASRTLLRDFSDVHYHYEELHSNRHCCAISPMYITITKSYYVTLRNGAELPPRPSLHPAVFLALRLHRLVNGFEGELESCRVNLTVGQIQGFRRVFVLLVREVAVRGANRIVVGHFAIRSRLRFRSFERHDSRFERRHEFDELFVGHLFDIRFHDSLRLSYTEIDVQKEFYCAKLFLYITITLYYSATVYDDELRFVDRLDFC